MNFLCRTNVSFAPDNKFFITQFNNYDTKICNPKRLSEV